MNTQDSGTDTETTHYWDEVSMKKVIDKPYSEDEWSFYGILAHRCAGKSLPLTFENSRGENAIVSGGMTKEGVKFFEVKTAQHNGWIAVNTYYEDGAAEETYEK